MDGPRVVSNFAIESPYHLTACLVGLPIPWYFGVLSVFQMTAITILSCL